MRRWSRIWAIVAALVLVATACGGGRGGDEAAGGGGSEYPDPGINDKEVLIGTSLPFSGPASVFGTFARATEAYFKYINETEGGVEMGDGVRRKLKLVAYDDAYSPPRTVENVRRLIEKDQVFALHGVLGTPTNTAIWDLVEQQKVPNLFVLTGATKWGADLENHRYTLGGLMAYSTETTIYADWLKRERPDAKLAVLYQNDDFGKDYLNTIRNQLEGSSVEIVATESYETTDADVRSQMTNLARSNADVFFNVATGKFPLQALRAKADIGWDALTLMHSPLANIETVFKPAGIEASKGAMAVKYMKEPGDPAYENDPAIQEYKELVTKYGTNIEVFDINNVSAWMFAETLVKVLEQTPEPTREALLETARSLDGLKPGLLIEGVEMRTGEDDGFLIETGQLVSFNGTGFDKIGELISMEGETPTEDVPGVAA